MLGSCCLQNNTVRPWGAGGWEEEGGLPIGLPAQRSMVSVIVCVCVCVCVRKRETVFAHLSSGLFVCVGERIFGSKFQLSYLVLLDDAWNGRWMSEAAHIKRNVTISTVTTHTHTHTHTHTLGIPSLLVSQLHAPFSFSLIFFCSLLLSVCLSHSHTHTHTHTHIHAHLFARVISGCAEYCLELQMNMK